MVMIVDPKGFGSAYVKGGRPKAVVVYGDGNVEYTDTGNGYRVDTFNTHGKLVNSKLVDGAEGIDPFIVRAMNKAAENRERVEFYC